MATACFIGLPAARSAAMFLPNACLLVDLIKGMVVPEYSFIYLIGQARKRAMCWHSIGWVQLIY
jgi:hypothetical protein